MSNSTPISQQPTSGIQPSSLDPKLQDKAYVPMSTKDELVDKAAQTALSSGKLETTLPSANPLTQKNIAPKTSVENDASISDDDVFSLLGDEASVDLNDADSIIDPLSPSINSEEGIDSLLSKDSPTNDEILSFFSEDVSIDANSAETNTDLFIQPNVGEKITDSLSSQDLSTSDDVLSLISGEINIQSDKPNLTTKIQEEATIDNYFEQISTNIEEERTGSTVPQNLKDNILKLKSTDIIESTLSAEDTHLERKNLDKIESLMKIISTIPENQRTEGMVYNRVRDSRLERFEDKLYCEDPLTGQWIHYIGGISKKIEEYPLVSEPEKLKKQLDSGKIKTVDEEGLNKIIHKEIDDFLYKHADRFGITLSHETMSRFEKRREEEHLEEARERKKEEHLHDEKRRLASASPIKSTSSVSHVSTRKEIKGQSQIQEEIRAIDMLRQQRRESEKLEQAIQEARQEQEERFREEMKLDEKTKDRKFRETIKSEVKRQDAMRDAIHAFYHEHQHPTIKRRHSF